MKTNFTIQDIKDFMLQTCNLKWYGEVYDEELDLCRLSSIEDDFTELKTNTLIVVKIRKNEQLNYFDSSRIQRISATIFENTFRISGSCDYSDEWQYYLASKKENSNLVV